MLELPEVELGSFTSCVSFFLPVHGVGGGGTGTQSQRTWGRGEQQRGLESQLRPPKSRGGATRREAQTLRRAPRGWWRGLSGDGELLQGPPSPATGQRWVSRARRDKVPSPILGCAHFTVTLPNLRGGEGTPKIFFMMTPLGWAPFKVLSIYFSNGKEFRSESKKGAESECSQDVS